MNYKAHYNRLIERAKNRLLEGYCELHHVIPRCMNGSDHADNLVRLTAEEHYVAHQLLVKIYPGNAKLIYAAGLMTVDRYGGRVNNKLFGWLKREIAKARSKEMTGKKRGPMSQETKDKIGAANKGRKISEAEYKMRIGRGKGRTPWNKGKKMPEGFGAAISARQLGIKRGPHTAETIAKISASKTGTTRTEEVKENMRQAALNRRPMSEETKLKMSMTRTGKKRGPYKKKEII